MSAFHLYLSSVYSTFISYRYVGVILLLGGLSPLALSRDDINMSETISPKGTFKVVQRHESHEWVSKICFSDKKIQDVRIIESYVWPATFYISPDEHWVFQIQGAGSGDNIAFLYRLDSNNHLWRLEEYIKEHCFAYLEKESELFEKDFYHTGLEFVAWDCKKEVLHFNLLGVSTNLSDKVNGHRIDRRMKQSLICNLKNFDITRDK